MKLRILLLFVMILPMLANAEIYKWKDKDGKMRYSDVPPPSNMKTESLYGKKIPRPTGQPPLAPVEGDATVEANKQKAIDKAGGKEVVKGTPLTKEEAAAKRSNDAEEKKKIDEANAEQQKFKQESCKAAQANLRNYQSGGRIVKTNEQGEREYLADADVAKAKEDAQKDIDKYCN